MVKDSLSKLVSNATKKASSQTGKVITGVRGATSSVVSGVSKGTSGVVRSGKKASGEVLKKLNELCNPKNVVPCLTAIILIVYMVVVNQNTVLDVFSTPVGKFISLFVVLVALLFDVRLGVMLGLAVVLSINMSSASNDVYESYDNDDMMGYEMSVGEEVPKEEPVVEQPVIEQPEEEMVMPELTGYDEMDMYSSLTEGSDEMQS